MNETEALKLSRALGKRLEEEGGVLAYDDYVNKFFVKLEQSAILNICTVLFKGLIENLDRDTLLAYVISAIEKAIGNDHSLDKESEESVVPKVKKWISTLGK